MHIFYEFFGFLIFFWCIFLLASDFFFFSSLRHHGPLIYHPQEPLVKPKHSFVNLVRTFMSMLNFVHCARLRSTINNHRYGWVEAWNILEPTTFLLTGMNCAKNLHNGRDQTSSIIYFWDGWHDLFDFVMNFWTIYDSFWKKRLLLVGK